MASSSSTTQEYDQHRRLAQINESPGFRTKLSEWFLPAFNRFYGPEADLVTKMNRRLSQARVDDTAEMFISRCIGYGVITGGLLWMFVTLSIWMFFLITGFEVPGLGVPITDPTLVSIINTLRTPVAITFLGIVFGGIGFILGFYAPMINVKMQVGARKREINTLLPDTVSYMYALSLGGMNQLEIIESVAESEDVYGEASAEFQTIVQETDYFDVDYRTAIRRRAEETPSDKLAQFLTDMLSIISTGGDITEFLNDKTGKHRREAKESQEDLIEVIELFGEMYLNLSLLPLLLLILLVIMQMMGGAGSMMLYMVIYVLIPMIGVGFIVMMSTILPDEPGDGRLEMSADDSSQQDGLLNFSTVKSYKGITPTFDKVYKKEFWHRMGILARRPHALFIEKPLYTLIITVPLSLIIIVAGLLTGIAPSSWDGMLSGLWGTVYYLYIPLYLILFPLTIFNWLSKRQISGVVDNYTEALRKLASANDTGQTLLESFVTVADTSTGKISTEFKAINAKVDYNYSVRQALTEFNNKYKDPQLARINNLIIDAQETSSNISEVLVTAAKTSESQDQLERERASRTRMQVVMVLMTFFILMAVMALLMDQFILTMGELGGDLDTDDAAAGGAAMDFDAIDPTQTGVLFLHAVAIQGITAGLLSSYLMSNTLRDSGKFIIPTTTIALVIWLFLV